MTFCIRRGYGVAHSASSYRSFFPLVLVSLPFYLYFMLSTCYATLATTMSPFHLTDILIHFNLCSLHVLRLERFIFTLRVSFAFVISVRTFVVEMGSHFPFMPLGTSCVTMRSPRERFMPMPIGSSAEHMRATAGALRESIRCADQKRPRPKWKGRRANCEKNERIRKGKTMICNAKEIVRIRTIQNDICMRVRVCVRLCEQFSNDTAKGIEDVR